MDKVGVSVAAALLAYNICALSRYSSMIVLACIDCIYNAKKVQKKIQGPCVSRIAFQASVALPDSSPSM